MPVNDALASETWYRFRYLLERGHYDFLAKADRCDKFVRGDQWLETDINALKLQRRPALTINKIQSTLSTIEGDQIQNRNEILFRPSTGANADTADALTKVWMQIAQDNQLNWVRSEVFSDGLVRSRGFYDVRLSFNESMKGEVKITQMNSKNVIVDSDAEEYDPDFWNDVFVTKWLTYQDIALLYNEEDAEYLRDKEASMFPYAYDSIERVRDRFAGTALQGSYYGLLDSSGVRRNIRVIERQYHQLARQKHFVDIQMGDMRPIPDGWDRNKIASVIERAGGSISVINKQIKRVRWTVSADNVILHDDWSPYKHFTVVPYFPRFRYGTTTGLVEHLLGPQELLNKTTSQELHVINTTANSGWKIKAGSLINMSMEELELKGATTGLILELQDVNDAEKIQPNQTPQGLDRLSYKSEEFMKSISNVTDSSQGNDREDVAAKAIAYKQQRSAVNQTKMFDNLERTDFLLARNVLDIIQEYYTEERLVHITHDDVTREPEQTAINQQTPEGTIINDVTLGKYDIVVISTPYRASMEDSQFSQALEMRKEGINIPDNVLVENSRLMRRSEIVKQMQDAANTPEAQQKAQLEMRLLQAQVGKVEAEVGDKQADTGLKGARAAKDTAQAQEIAKGDTSGQTDLMRMQAEMQLERERTAAELEKMREEMAMRQQEMQQDMAMKLQQHQQDMEISRQKAEQDAQLKAQAAADKAAQDKADHYAKRAQEAKSSTSSTSA